MTFYCPRCGATNLQVCYPIWLDLNDVDGTPDWQERIDSEARPERDSDKVICGTCDEHVLPVEPVWETALDAFENAIQDNDGREKTVRQRAAARRVLVDLLKAKSWPKPSPAQAQRMADRAHRVSDDSTYPCPHCEAPVIIDETSAYNECTTCMRKSAHAEKNVW